MRDICWSMVGWTRSKSVLGSHRSNRCSPGARRRCARRHISKRDPRNMMQTVQKHDFMLLKLLVRPSEGKRVRERRCSAWDHLPKSSVTRRKLKGERCLLTERYTSTLSVSSPCGAQDEQGDAWIIKDECQTTPLQSLRHDPMACVQQSAYPCSSTHVSPACQGTDNAVWQAVLRHPGLLAPA